MFPQLTGTEVGPCSSLTSSWQLEPLHLYLGPQLLILPTLCALGPADIWFGIGPALVHTWHLTLFWSILDRGSPLWLTGPCVIPESESCLESLSISERCRERWNMSGLWELRRTRKWFFQWSLQKGTQFCPHFYFQPSGIVGTLTSRTVRKYTCVVLSHLLFAVIC